VSYFDKKGNQILFLTLAIVLICIALLLPVM
jgi:hypothetical protein